MKKLEELRVVDLRAELDKRGLDKTGVKAILIERLKKSIQTEGGDPEAYEYIESKSLNKSFQEDEHESMEFENSYCDSVNDLKESVNAEEGINGENCTADDTKIQKVSSSPRKKEAEVDSNEEHSHNGEPAAAAAADDDKSNATYIEDKEVSMRKEEEDELRDLEEELLMEGEEEELNEEVKEDGDGLTREDYARHMEDDSINLMLEDDDKMLDYEENDRIDMEEISSTDFKDKDDTNSTRDISSESSHKEDSSNEKKQIKSESDNTKSSKNRNGEGKEEKKEKSQTESINNRNLWVSGLASNTRAQDLKSLFSKHGKVLSAKIVTNAKTPGAKCYGFVTMASTDDASKCIGNLNRTELHGRMIQVEKAKGEPGGPKGVSVSKSNSQTSKNIRLSNSDGKEGDKSKDSTSKRDSQKRGDSRGKNKESSEKDKSLSSTRERVRHSRGKSSSESRLLSRSSERERDKDRRSKESDLRNRLSAKDRVVDRRHEARRSGFSSPQKRSPRRDMLSLHRIMEERERQRLRTRERLMREEERMRRDEAIHLRNLERRQKEEAERLHREREKLRLEREKIERQKQELLRMEREQQRMEREKLERERDELRKQQIKYEEVRRGVKRPVPPNDRDRRDFYDDRKRAVTDRGPSPPRAPDRSATERNMHRGGPDRGSLLRGPDRGGSVRSTDRATERGPDHRGAPRVAPERRFNDDERESRYDHRHGDRVPAIRGSSQYDDRRERDDRRPIDRSVPRGEGRDHRGGPLPPTSQTMRDRPTRESHYNGSSMSGVAMDSWRTGRSAHSSKNGNGPSYGSSSSGMMSGSVSRGVDNPNNWRPSSSITTNERWGGANSSGMGGGRSSIMDILRGGDSYHMSGGQVPMNPVPLMSGMSQGDRFAGVIGGFRK